MIKIKISIIFTILFLSSFLIYTTVKAEDNNPVPKLSVSDSSLYQGSYGQISVTIENIVSLSALSFSVYYEAEVIEISSIQKSLYTSGMIDINTDLQGVIQYAMISATPFSDNGVVMYINFYTKANASIGDHSIIIAVEEAYDENLTELPIQGKQGSVTILENNPVLTQVYLQQSLSKTNVMMGDTLTYTISSSQLKNLGAAEFKLYYDKEILELNHVNLGSSMTKSDALYSINTDTAGYVHISYATNIGISSAYPIATFEFLVIANINQSTLISLNTSNAYNDLLEPMYIAPYENTMQITQIEEQPNYPDLTMTKYEGPNDQPFTIDLEVSPDSGIAAGDFVIEYDHTKLILDSLMVMDDVSARGGVLIYNPDFQNGAIRFSYINEDGITDQQSWLRLYFTPSQAGVDIKTTVTIKTTGLVDQNFDPVYLDTIHSTIELATYHTITFNDYNGQLIERFEVKDGALIVEPETPTRDKAIFVGWDQTFAYASSDLTLQAIHRLDMDFIEFNPYTATYSGNPFFIDVIGLPIGAEVDYGEQMYRDAGTYDFTVDISLDGHYQSTLQATLTIEPKPITIVINSQTKRYGEEDPIFTYTIDGLPVQDIIDLKPYTLSNDTVGEHVITATFEHPNYIASITNGMLTINKGVYDLTNIAFENKTVIFSGNPYTMVITGVLPDGVSVEYIYTENISIGEHMVEVRFTGDSLNYETIESIYALLIIEKGLFNEIKGDVNFDGVVDIIDVGIIQMYIAGLRSLNETQITYADINEDGLVDIRDAGKIQLYISKLIDTLE